MATPVRGKAWSAQETQALVEAYIHCSEDEIKSTNRTQEAFFDAVEEEVKKRYPGMWTRPIVSMRKQWRLVSSEVQRLIDALEVAKSTDRSGWSDEMYLKYAEDLFLEKQKTHPDAFAKPFKSHAEWNIMKNHQKWRTFGSWSGKWPNSSDSDNSEPMTSAKRPMGQKKAKQSEEI